MYDNLYQLTGENRTGTTPFRNTFTYDPLGNRLTKTESAARTTYTYDAANQLRYGQDTTGRTTYTFDAAGNQAKEKSPAGAITTTTWNYENQPTLYKLPDATRVTMSYHPDHLRVQKDAPTGTTKFIWDQQNYLAEADGSNIVTTVYTNEPARYGNLVSSKIGATPYYHSFDAIGSTRELTDGGANFVSTSLYGAWGELLLSGSSTLFGWLGENGYARLDSVNAIYVRARLYSVNAARWTSRDPLLINMGRTTVLFIYGSNSPLSTIDPSGLLEFKTKEGEHPAEMECSPIEGKQMKSGRCGRFHWEIEWVPSAGETDGLIIQRVQMCRSDTPCEHTVLKPFLVPDRFKNCKNTNTCGSEGNPCIEYYELWRVYKGGVYRANVFGNTPTADNATDTFAWYGREGFCAKGCTYEDFSIEGEAFFVPIDLARRELESEFSAPPGGVKNACDLVSACANKTLDDRIENLRARVGAQIVYRAVRSEWDCCCAKKPSRKAPCTCCIKNDVVFSGDNGAPVSTNWNCKKKCK